MMVTWECTRRGCTETTTQPAHASEVGHQDQRTGEYHLMRKRRQGAPK